MLAFLINFVSKKISSAALSFFEAPQIEWLKLLQLWLKKKGVGNLGMTALFVILLGLVVVLIRLVAYFLSEGVFIGILSRWGIKSEKEWKELFQKEHVTKKLFHTLVWICFIFLLPMLLPQSIISLKIIQPTLLFFALVSIALLVESFLDVLHELYLSYEVSSEIPLRGILQLSKVMLFFVCVILSVAIFLGKSPLYLLSGLGAFTALLMLVFKNSLLGLAAGFQVAFNQIIAVGDKVSIPKQGIIGEVTEIGLTTTKVKKVDGTIFSFPTLLLTSDVIVNHRSEDDHDSRISQKSFTFDLASVKPFSSTLRDNVTQRPHINEALNYCDEPPSISEDIDFSLSWTNLDVFQEYLEYFIDNHDDVNEEDTMFVLHNPENQKMTLQVVVVLEDCDEEEEEFFWRTVLAFALENLPYFELKLS